jgi:hypothetical protein
MITAAEADAAVSDLVHHTDDLVTGNHPWAPGW